MIEQGVVAVLAIFLAGVIFHSGRLTSRVDALESDRRDMKDDLTRIRSVVDNIDGALRHEFVYEGTNGRRRDDRGGG